MKKKLLSLLLSAAIIGLVSCKKELSEDSQSNEAVLKRGNLNEILAVRTSLEAQALAENPAVEKFYDITISLFSPIEFHEVFCAWPATDCLKEVVITPTPTAARQSNATKEDKSDYKYEYRGEKEVSSTSLLRIIPRLNNFPSFKESLENAGTVKVKIVTDYKTLTKYLKVYTIDGKAEEIIFAAPVDDEFITKFDAV